VLAGFARRAADKVALLGIDTEDEQRLALLFAKDVGQHWPAVVDDDGAFMRRYSPGPPVTLFVTAEGAVSFVHRGPFDSVDEVVAAVRRHLGVTV
jgi:cytochrome c biogenesis protein CcmG, thiol:disulfide interchange protein DsbE